MSVPSPSDSPVDEPLRAICVFCGAMPGARESYVAAARTLGETLARRSITLVYGGGHVGMMGAVADAALAGSGRVVGVIPTHLMRPEIAHRQLSELIVVDSMHTRKRTMAQRADAFIVLPGGFGTFEELFEMATWLQLGLQAKPVGILNVDGYYDQLMAFLQHAAAEEFIRPAHRNLLLVDDDPGRLIDRLAARAAPLAPAEGLDLG